MQEKLQTENLKDRENPLIYVDQREFSSGIDKKLEELNAEVRKKQLEVGDYVASNRTAIERKTKKDFINSIIDKRLFEQAENLKKSFTHPIIIIEGNNNHLKNRRIHPNALRGAIASIALEYEIPILHTDNKNETASLIYRIAYREQIKEKRNVRVKGKKTPKMIPEQQLNLVQSIPGIGPELAESLLEEFKTIEEIVKASKTQLKKVEGVGEKKAKEIRKLLTEEWKDQ